MAYELHSNSPRIFFMILIKKNWIRNLFQTSFFIIILITLSQCSKDTFQSQTSSNESSSENSSSDSSSDGTSSKSSSENSSSTSSSTSNSANPYENLKIGFLNTTLKDDDLASEYYTKENVDTILSTMNNMGTNYLGVSAYDGDAEEDCNEEDKKDDYLGFNASAGYKWCHLLKIIETSAEKYPEISIQAFFKEKHQTSKFRFLEETSEDIETYSEENYTRWTSAWETTANTLSKLSKLSKSYANFKYWGPDDFSAHICSPINSVEGDTRYNACYTKEQIQSIISASHDCSDCNSDFQFIPVMYFTHLPRFLYPSYILGASYNTKIYPNSDEAKVELSFSLEEKPNLAELSFYYYDDEKSSDANIDNLYLTITVNGNEIFSEPALDGNDYIQKYNDDITAYLCSEKDLSGCSDNDMNTISFTLAPHPDHGGVNSSHHKYLYLWNVEIKTEDQTISTFEEEFSTKYYEGTGYTVDGETITSNKNRIIATNNKDYLINDIIDGATIFFSIANESQFSDENFTALIKYTQELLEGKTFFLGLYGILWNYTHDFDKLSHQIDVGATYADGIVSWNYPLYLSQKDQGIFSENTSDLSTYSHVMLWPRNQSGVRNYYKTYTTKTKVTGKIKIKLKDANSTSFASNKYFIKEITDSDGNSHYEEYIGSNDGNEEEVQINLGTNEVYLSISLKENKNVGSTRVKLYFNSLNDDDTSLTDIEGNPVDWEFSSGTTDEDTLNTYCLFRDKFLNFSEKSIADELLIDWDSDGVEDCSY